MEIILKVEYLKEIEENTGKYLANAVIYDEDGFVDMTTGEYRHNYRISIRNAGGANNNFNFHKFFWKRIRNYTISLKRKLKLMKEKMQIFSLNKGWIYYAR